MPPYAVGKRTALHGRHTGSSGVVGQRSARAAAGIESAIATSAAFMIDRSITVLQKARNRQAPFDADVAVVAVRTAILDHRLTEADLSARGVAEHLGLTTSVFYHHYGSFELFLYAVSVSGLGWL